jgi:Carbohydrate-binding module 48 (Isoamylase N-terminal domain)
MAGLKTYSTQSGTRFPPGASATAQGVNFSLFSKTASRVELLLYDELSRTLSHLSLIAEAWDATGLKPSRRGHFTP